MRSLQVPRRGRPFGVPVELLEEFVEQHVGKEIEHDDLWDVVLQKRDKLAEQYNLTLEQHYHIGWSLFDHICEVAVVR